MKASSISVALFYRRTCTACDGQALQAATASSSKYTSSPTTVQKHALQMIGGSGDTVLGLCGF